MKKIIYNIVQEQGCVSFPDLIAQVPGARGDETIYLKENLILWENVSSAFKEAIIDLQDEGKIELHVVGVLSASLLNNTLRDQGLPCPPYPIGQQNRVYKNPRWLPVSIKNC